ncbi:ABC transporter ATP-binding protein [Bacillus dakarensis]|uniref:ABC transporter ATP-binding protein n=1 Tax=Robertmurraya dakarensis TaxID=1926278 RepID=UPI00098202C8|nr:ABC transporter ATP-binding protein [Bacillus dakarensis]
MSLLKVDIKSAGYEKAAATINDIAFTVEEGELIGLIGPNGAGKSTTIKSILGLLENIEGSVTYGNDTPYSYIPERPIFYDELTLWEHLDFVAAIEGLPDMEYQKQAYELLEKYRLVDHAHEYPAKYSKGMQQKAMLILAMMTNPSLYIIDEPFMGLDPHAMKLFLESIDKERGRGAGVLMSTHVLDTAEKICDRFIMINKGHLVAKGALDEIRRQCNLPTSSLFDCFHFLTEGDENEQ